MVLVFDSRFLALTALLLLHAPGMCNALCRKGKIEDGNIDALSGVPDTTETMTKALSNGTLPSHSGRTVALHWSLFQSNGPEWGQKFLDRLQTLNFCFNEILVTVDTVHGGKDYGPRYLPRPPGRLDAGAQIFRDSPGGKAFLAHADGVVQKGKSWLQNKCPTTHITARVQLIDYADPQVRAALHQSFDVNGMTSVPYSAWKETYMPPGTGEYPFARMWKNSFAYMYPFTIVKSQFLFHADSDLPNLWPNKVPGPNFIARGVDSLMAHPDVVMVMPPDCKSTFASGKEFATHSCDNRGCHALGDDLFSIERNVPDAQHPVVTFVSTQRFVSDVQRMKSTWPIRYWTDMFEVTLMQHFADKGVKSAKLQRGFSNLCA